MSAFGAFRFFYRLQRAFGKSPIHAARLAWREAIRPVLF